MYDQRIADLERQLDNATLVVAILTKRLAGIDGAVQFTRAEVDEARRMTLHVTHGDGDVISYWLTEKKRAEPFDGFDGLTLCPRCGGAETRNGALCLVCQNELRDDKG